jgi:hypothetical protein
MDAGNRFEPGLNFGADSVLLEQFSEVGVYFPLAMDIFSSGKFEQIQIT